MEDVDFGDTELLGHEKHKNIKARTTKKTSTTKTNKFDNIAAEKYLSSLTKLRRPLDAKFLSAKPDTTSINNIKVDLEPYQVTELTTLRDKLFNIPLCESAYKYLNKTRHKNMIDILDGLTRGVSNLVNEKYPQLYKISNAYVKLWEIYETFDWLLSKSNSQGNDIRQVNFFHMAEAPGQWINTTNHYFNQHMPPRARYNWFANTLNPKHPRMKGIINALPDNYGFIKQHPKKWLYGADGSGDITLAENVAWFNEFLLREIPDNLDIITGDAGTSHTETDIELLQRIDISQSIVVACVARPGSSCIIKHFLPYLKSKSKTKMADGFFISFMYLYHLLFAEFHMFKPLASSPGSGEFYVVARGFHGITQQQRQLLLDYQANFTINKPMFAKQDIPESFINKVSQFIIELQEAVILNGKISCELIDYCYGPESHNKSNDCIFTADTHKFFAEKEKDLETYIDKYRIARVDKLKKRTFKKHTHHKLGKQPKGIFKGFQNGKTLKYNKKPSAS